MYSYTYEYIYIFMLVYLETFRIVKWDPVTNAKTQLPNELNR